MLRGLSVVATVLIVLLIALLVRDHFNLPSKTLTIFYTSNLRGQLNPFVSDVDDRQNLKVGGLAFIKGLIGETIRNFRLNPQLVLLLDTGDSLFGSAEASLTQGDAPFNMMVKTGYDAMAVGNMEFEFGMETLRRFAANDRLPLLACNYRDLKATLGNTFLPGKIIEKDGVKIGIIGLGHADLARNTRQENLLQIEITEAIPSVQKTATLLKTQGAQVIVLISHQPGFEALPNLAEVFPDVDVILADLVSAAKVPATGRPLICATPFSRGAGLGIVKIPCIGGVWEVSRAFRNTMVVEAEAIVPDPELVSEISKVESKVDTMLDKVIATANGDFKRAYSEESTVGDLLTDCMRAAAKADIAFQNSGAIKIAFAKGPIALRDLFEMLPFENSLVKVTLFGWQIENMIEHSLSERGSFMQASGIDCTYSSDNPPGFRTIQIGIDNQPIEWDKQYTVAVSDFMVENQLNWPELARGKNPVMIGPLREIFKNYLTEIASLSPNVNRRFNDIQDMDETLRIQAMSIELASLSQPIIAEDSIESSYGRLLADVLRTETDSDFAFVPRNMIKSQGQPFTVLTPGRIAHDINEYTSVQTLQLSGNLVQKIIEVGLTASGSYCFSGMSVELKDGRLSRIFPWEGDFDAGKMYKVALPQKFPSRIEGWFDLRDRQRQNVFSDLRRTFITGLRRRGGKTELRHAIY